jgi:hypothetical protein
MLDTCGDICIVAHFCHGHRAILSRSKNSQNLGELFAKNVRISQKLCFLDPRWCFAVSVNHSNYRLWKIRSRWCGCYCCYLKMLLRWICSGGDGSSGPSIVVKSLKMQFRTKIYFFNIWYSIKLASFRREFQNDWSLITNVCIRVWRIHFQLHIGRRWRFI